LKRDKSRRAQKEDDSALTFAEYFYEGVEKIMGQFKMNPLDLPFLHLKDPFKFEKYEIEEIAMQIRRHWGLGELPIKTLSNLLFSRGILVQRVDMEWDGVSFVENEIPVILIKDREEKSRDKTTINHELGHLVLHHLNPYFEPSELSKSEMKTLEEQAFFFGTCFAMPRASYLKDVYKTTYQCLRQIKAKWQTSIGCQIMYLGGLECISSEEKTSLFRAMNWHQRGGGKREPNEEMIVFEEADFLGDAIKCLHDSGNRSMVDQAAQILPNPIGRIFQRETAVVIEFPFNLPPTSSETSA
jgi:Zn-dependent peptidase ImmA (M78 family)